MAASSQRVFHILTPAAFKMSRACSMGEHQLSGCFVFLSGTTVKKLNYTVLFLKVDFFPGEGVVNWLSDNHLQVCTLPKLCSDFLWPPLNCLPEVNIPRGGLGWGGGCAVH